jgi:predicted nucleotidyltransferase
MKVLGIVSEYNPFHHGHLHHLQKSREIVEPDFTISVMSGNFTQRGEAAIADKWIRTEAALRNGVDVVLELPVVFSVQTAERFAYGAIQVLNLTGCVTHISFGSEIGDIEPLMKIASVLSEEPLEYQRLLKGFIKKGLSFPTARFRALNMYMEDRSQSGHISLNDNGGRQKGLDDSSFSLNNRPYSQDATSNSLPNSDRLKRVLSSPNSILGIEYLKALKRVNSSIEAVSIPRIKAGYHSTELKSGISSATAVRREIFKAGFSHRLLTALPEATTRVLSSAFAAGKGPVNNYSFENTLLSILRRSSLEEIRSWMDVSEGLEYRIKEHAMNSASINELLSGLKTKRYVYTRLQRILINGLLGITGDIYKEFEEMGGPQYIRILGLKETARPLLRAIKTNSRVPVITKAAHIGKCPLPAREMFSFECLATDLYSLALKNPSARKGGRDYTEGVVIV